MAQQSMQYRNEMYRGGPRYPDRESEPHYITPPIAYSQRDPIGFSNRQSEASYYYDSGKEPHHPESRYHYPDHRSHFSQPHHDRGYPRPHEAMHHENHPHPILNFPPRHKTEERFPIHERLPPPRPFRTPYSHEHGERLTHVRGRESPPAEVGHFNRSVSPRSDPMVGERSKSLQEGRVIDQAPSNDSTIETTASNMDGHKGAVVEMKEEVGKEKDIEPLEKPKSGNNEMLNDALLLASVAKMARSEADHVPETSKNVIERTVSVDAKDGPLNDPRRTPSPQNSQLCTAVTPSLSHKAHRLPSKDYDSHEIKNKPSQVSMDDTASLDRPLRELKTNSSPEHGPERVSAPRHPLSYAREENTTRHYHGRSPSFSSPSHDRAPPRKVENEADASSENSRDSDHHRVPHYPNDNYRHPYHPPAGPRPGPHVRYPFYRPPPHYEEGPYSEEEGRYYHYPPTHPANSHRPRYPDERAHFPPPPGHFIRPPGYHGMPPQPYADRRGGVVGPPRAHEGYIPAGHRVPPPDYRGYPLHHPRGKAQPPQQSGKIILRRKCAWKNYPELEHFLIENREEYLRHSARNYTQEQKQYNNDLTERLLDVAAKHNYEFDRNDFNFVAIRDRIRCYYKSYVQNCKKRGISINHKSNKKQKLQEEDDVTKDTIPADSNDVTEEKNERVGSPTANVKKEEAEETK
jgi:hypothetical protein